MTEFPELTVEADLGGWTDLSGDIYTRTAVSLTSGRSNEAGQVEPSSLSMTLDNRTGAYSPRNPRGPYYGILGRNTPVRAYVSRGALALELPGGASDLASTPDSASVSITGDIDVRIDLTTACWSQLTLCGKYKTASDQRSWALQTRDDGTLSLVWTTAGTSASAALAASTMPIPLYPGRRAVRVVLDVDNGAGSNATTFYTAPTMAGPWTQLGGVVVGAQGTTGTTSIYDSTAPVEVGQVPDLPNIAGFTSIAPRATIARVHAFELRAGTTLVANPDFTSHAAGTTSFTDGTGATWTLQGGTAINARRWLMHGELSNLPPTSDISGADVTVAAQAGGLLRRLGQGSTALRSTIYRGVLSEQAVVSYWPCEDGSDATGLASGLTHGQPITISGTASLGASSVFAASESLPTVQSSSWTGQATAYAPTGASQVRLLLAIPAAGTVNNAVLARVYTTGRAAQWDVIYTTAASGGLSLAVYDNDGNTLIAGSTTTGYNGALLRITLDLTQNGSNVDGTLWALSVGDTTGAGLPVTATSATFNRVKAVVINPGTAALGDVTVGHISVHSAITSLLDLSDELTGYLGETAGRRVERLCAEAGITFRAIGSMDDTAAMGVQRPGELLSLLQECAAADLGILYEPREVLGVGYRARSSMHNQPARAALTYGQLDALTPVDDDQLLRNEWVVSRTGGSSARFEATDGALSVLDPPDGAGRYDDSATINVAADSQLLDQASWRVHLGTVDEPRFPSIGINFAAPEISTDGALVESLLELELGDRITIDDPPSWLPPDQISQLIQHREISLLPFQHAMKLTGAPESPYRIAVYDSGDGGRYGTAGSELAAGVTSSATTLSVTTVTGPLWTTNPAHLPFDIYAGGEQMTVTAITGATSPQTFTVTRGVNGFAGSHTAGTAVRLAALTYRRL